MAYSGRIYRFFGERTVKHIWFRSICWLTIFSFFFCSIGQNAALAQTSSMSPVLIPPGTLMSVSPSMVAPNLKAIFMDPTDPFKIDFVLDKSDKSAVDHEELDLLVKYFLTFLTIPEEDLWVNLSPNEKDRVVPVDLENTPVGRDMLAQDYILKQMSSSLTYPKREPGISYWKKINEQLEKQNADLDFQADTFSRVWIVPDETVVYEHENSAFIASIKLKVMLEEDYVNFKQNQNLSKDFQESADAVNKISSDVAREVLIPILEKEVNEGQHFARMRQMYHALVLAIWWKKRLKGDLINKVYVDQKKTAGVTLDEEGIKERIYEQYILSMKKGAYDFMQDEYDPAKQRIVTRKYFSGGFDWKQSRANVNIIPDNSQLSTSSFSEFFRYLRNLGRRAFPFSVQLRPSGVNMRTLQAAVFGVALLAGGTGVALAGDSGDGSAPLSASATTLVAGGGVVDNPAYVFPGQSNRVIKMGSRAGDFFPYFQALQVLVSPDDVSALHGNSNNMSRGTYNIDAYNFDSTQWQNNFPQSAIGTIDVKAQTVIVAFQEKMNIGADGVMGKGTREAIRTELQKAGFSFYFGDDLIQADTTSPSLSAGESLNLPSHVEPNTQAESESVNFTASVTTDTPTIVLPQTIDEFNAGINVPAKYRPIFEAMKLLLVVQDYNNLDGAVLDNNRPYHLNSQNYDSENFYANFPSEPNYWFGPKTLTTVLAFQHLSGITADGWVGPNTLAAIKQGLIDKNIDFEVEGRSGQSDVDINGDVHVTGMNPVLGGNSLVTEQVQIGGDNIDVASSATPAGSPPPPPDDMNVLGGQSYFVDTNVTLVPVQGQITAQSDGIVQIANPVREEYLKGDVILSVLNQEIQTELNRISGQLGVDRQYLERLEALEARSGMVTFNELKDARLAVLDLEQQHANLQKLAIVQTIRAPYDLTVDYMISEGMTVSPNAETDGTILLHYRTQNRATFDVTVPTTRIDFRNMKFTLNGQLVHIRGANWKLEPSQDLARVTWDVLLPDGMHVDQGPFQLHAEMPQSFDPNPELADIEGRSALASVRAPVEHVISAPQTGVLDVSVYEGDYVISNQNMGKMDADAYVQERSRVARALQVLQGLLDDPNAQIGLSRRQKNQIESQMAELQSQIQLLDDQINHLSLRAPATGGRVTWTLDQGIVEQGDPVAKISTGKVLIGSQTNPEQALLFPENLNIQPGDGVIVQTPGGSHLAGKVLIVDNNPFSRQLNFQDVSSLQIEVHDANGILGEGLPVKVLVPESENDKDLIQTVLDRPQTFTNQGGSLSPVVTYSGLTEVGKAWSLMSPLMESESVNAHISSIEEILIRDANPQTRKEALDNFLAISDQGGEFSEPAARIILDSLYPDVVQQLLKHMSGRSDHDLGFFIRIINDAQNQGKRDKMEWAYQAMKDMLTDYPEIFQDLSESLLVGEDGLDQDAVRRVMLTLAIRESGSMVTSQLLSGDYWTPDELAQIYGTLTAYQDGLVSGDPAYPYRDMINALSGKVYSAVLRNQINQNIMDVYPQKNFYLTAILDEDIYRHRRSVWLEQSARDVTRRVDLDSDSGYLFHPKLFNAAIQGVDSLSRQYKPKFTAGVPPSVINLSLLQASTSADAFMQDFNRLGENLQLAHLNQTQSLSHLVRVLKTEPKWHDLTLSRLMKTEHGRFLIMEVYLDSDSADQLKTKIENLNWTAHLRSMARSLHNPATTDIFRQATLLMGKKRNLQYTNWADNPFLNARLESLTWSEYSQFEDPRADVLNAYLRAKALERAVDFVKSKKLRQEHLPGIFGSLGNWVPAILRPFTPNEEALFDAIKKNTQKFNNPLKIDAYIAQLRQSGLNRNEKKLLKDILYWRDRIVTDVENNNYRVPLIPEYNTRSFLVVMALLITYFGFKFYRNFRRKRQVLSSEEVINDLGQRLGIKGTDVFMRNGKPLTQHMVYMVELIQQWDNASPDGLFDEADSAQLSATKIITDMHTINTSAGNVLRTQPYTEELMKSMEIDKIENLSYWVTISELHNVMLKVFDSVNLQSSKGIKFTELQRRQLALCVDRLKLMIDYTGIFLFILQNRFNLNAVTNEKLPDDHWVERIGGYPFIRWALGYKYQINKTTENVLQNIPILLAIGERLWPGYYSDDLYVGAEDRSINQLTKYFKSSEIFMGSERLLKGVVKNATSFIPGERITSLESKISRYKRRLAATLTLIFPLLGAIGLFLNFPAFHIAISVATIASLSWNYFHHWKPNLTAVRSDWDSINHELVKKLDKDFNRWIKRNSAQVQSDRSGDFLVRSVDLSKQEMLFQLKREMDQAKAPSFDAIVFIAEDPQQVSEIEEYRSLSEGTFLRSDVLVDVVSFEENRGSLNQYFWAFQDVKRKWTEGKFRDQLSGIPNIPFSQTRIGFVFVPKGLAGKEMAERLTTSLQNLYRAGASMEVAGVSGGKKVSGSTGWHVLIYVRDQIDGPINYHPGNISLIGTWISQRDLSRFGLLNITPGSDRVREILEKLALEKIFQDRTNGRPSAIRDALNNEYLMNRPDLVQFPALAGLMMFDEKMVDFIDRLVDVLADSGEVWPALRYLHITGDLLKICLMDEDEIKSYIQRRMLWDSNFREARRRNKGPFKEFFDLIFRIRKEIGGLTMSASMSPIGMERVTQFNGDFISTNSSDSNNVASSQSAIDDSEQSADRAILSNPVGGIDISAVKDRIEFKSSDVPMPASSSLPAPSLEAPAFIPSLNAFQGFEFQILPLQPAGFLSRFLNDATEELSLNY